MNSGCQLSTIKTDILVLTSQTKKRYNISLATHQSNILPIQEMITISWSKL